MPIHPYSKRLWPFCLFICLFASGAALFSTQYHQLRARDEEIVYLQNVPFTCFLGHVVERNGKITLVKNYPLYEDDWRDGIWSTRVAWSGDDPIEKITFSVPRKSQDRHGILFGDRTWRIVWFEFDSAVRQNDGRLKWALMDWPDRFSSEWLGKFSPPESSLRGRVQLLATDGYDKRGIQKLIDSEALIDGQDEGK